jgi:hypothetical protein
VTAWLKRWTALGGAALVAAAATMTAVGVTQCNRRDDARESRATAAGDLAMWRIATDRQLLDAQEKERATAGKLDTIDRRTARTEAMQLAMLVWMQAASSKLGVPPPPDPSSLASMDPSRPAAGCGGPGNICAAELIDPFDLEALAQRLEKCP